MGAPHRAESGVDHGLRSLSRHRSALTNAQNLPGGGFVSYCDPTRSILTGSVPVVDISVQVFLKYLATTSILCRRVPRTLLRVFFVSRVTKYIASQSTKGSRPRLAVATRHGSAFTKRDFVSTKRAW